MHNKFIFHDSTYSIISGSGLDIHFGYVYKEGYFTWVDESFIYHTNKELLSVYSAEDGWKVVDSVYNYDFTSVFSSPNKVYFGTDTLGILYLDKEILTNHPTSSGVYSSFETYKQYPEITGNYVRHIHGYNDRLVCVTNSGIDYIKQEPNGYRSLHQTEYARRCFVTEDGSLYYITTSGSHTQVNRCVNCLTDWSEPDVSYSFFEPGVYVNDLKVHKLNTGSLVLLATNYGVYVINEQNETIDIYRKIGE